MIERIEHNDLIVHRLTRKPLACTTTCLILCDTVTLRNKIPFHSETVCHGLNLHGQIKPQSNGPLYSNMVISTLAADGWAVTFGTVRSGLGPRPVLSSVLSVPHVTAHPSTASVPTSYYLMWTIIASGL